MNSLRQAHFLKQQEEVISFCNKLLLTKCLNTQFKIVNKQQQQKYSSENDPVQALNCK